MEREHTRVHEENKTEAGKVRWVQWDGLDDVGGPVGRRWGWPDEDEDSWMKMGTNPDRVVFPDSELSVHCSSGIDTKRGDICGMISS